MIFWIQKRLYWNTKYTNLKKCFKESQTQIKNEYMGTNLLLLCHIVTSWMIIISLVLSWHKTLLHLTLTPHSVSDIVLPCVCNYKSPVFLGPIQHSFNICSSINTNLLWSLVGNVGINNRKRRFYYFIISLSVYFYCK